MRRFIRDHSLSIVTLGAFLVIWLGGQSWAGHRAFNDEQRAHGEPTVSFPEYLRQADFGEATFENWESEFLQMGVYVLLTTWLIQKGSAESKPPEGDPTVEADPREHRNDPGAPWPVRRGGWVLRIYENSLSIAMLTLFATPSTPSRRPMANPPSRPSGSFSGPSSGSSRSRTGNRSSSPSAASSCSASICASGAHPSPSRSTPHTPAPAPTDRNCGIAKIRPRSPDSRRQAGVGHVNHDRWLVAVLALVAACRGHAPGVSTVGPAVD
jgi:hypothetical protein